MSDTDLFTTRKARFSPDRVHRYRLEIRWDPVVRLCAFIGLNPSTADEWMDDPTIRRCRAFAESWGYGGMVMLNLFALRATDPKVMMAAADPIGPNNDAVLLEETTRIIEAGGVVIAAWGVHGGFHNRGEWVREFLPGPLSYLRLTKDGFPEHPLYLPGILTPKEWGKAVLV